MTTYLRQLWAIAEKDLRVELRTGERVAAMGAFVVLAGVLFNYSIDRTALHPREIAAGLIWMIIVLSGLLGIGRTFELEKGDGAMEGLLLAPVPRDALYLGKVLANVLLLGMVVLLTLFVVALFFDVNLLPNLLWILAVLATGVIGFVALGTLFSAISAGTRIGETLLPVLLFPLLVPLVVFGAAATSSLIGGFPPELVYGNLRVLAGFSLIALVAGMGLFRFIVEE